MSVIARKARTIANIAAIVFGLASAIAGGLLFAGDGRTDSAAHHRGVILSR